MGKLELYLPSFYHQLPYPADALGPCDTELNYMMWMPGFEWRPEPVYEDDEDLKEGLNTQISESDMKEALAEMVEQDDMKKNFEEIATGGYAGPEDAAILARKLGLAPSQEDVQKLKQEKGTNITYADFQDFLARCTHPEERVEDMIGAIKGFDLGETGVTSLKQLRNILRILGEPLTDDEIDRSFKKLSIQGDPINIEEICHKFINRD